MEPAARLPGKTNLPIYLLQRRHVNRTCGGTCPCTQNRTPAVLESVKKSKSIVMSASYSGQMMSPTRRQFGQLEGDLIAV